MTSALCEWMLLRMNLWLWFALTYGCLYETMIVVSFDAGILNIE